MRQIIKTAMCACACALAASAFGVKLSDSVPKGWGEDFAAASAEAKKDGKLMLLAFSGSDWCGWCVKMEKEIYSDKKFINEAKRKFVLVMIDKPRNKKILSKLAQKQNPELVEKYGISGYPSTIIARPDGEVVTRFVGFQNGGVAAFLEKLNAAAKAAGVGNGAAGGDAAADGKEAEKDDRFFFEAADRAKILARESQQRKTNAASDFEIESFAGIQFGASKADGAPTLAQPYHGLSVVKRTSYLGGKLSGVTLAAQPKDVKAMSADELRAKTCELVQAIEADLDVKLAVSGSKIDFTGKKTSIVVTSSKSSGTLSVQVTKKK